MKRITITLTEQPDPFYDERTLVKGITAWIQGNLENQRDKIEADHGEGSAFDFVVVWSDADHEG